MTHPWRHHTTELPYRLVYHVRNRVFSYRPRDAHPLNRQSESEWDGTGGWRYNVRGLKTRTRRDLTVTQSWAPS